MSSAKRSVSIKKRQRVRAASLDETLQLGRSQNWANWDSYGFALAQRVRVVRIMRGITQMELAKLAGVSRNFVSNLERNETASQTASDPVLSKIYRLAMALNVPPAMLLPSVTSEVQNVCKDDANITGITPLLVPTDLSTPN